MKKPLDIDVLPDSAYVREAHLVSSPHALLPFSASTLWRMVAAGLFPRPTKLAQRITVWRVGDVRAWLAYQAEQSGQSQYTLEGKR